MSNQGDTSNSIIVAGIQRDMEFVAKKYQIPIDKLKSHLGSMPRDVLLELMIFANLAHRLAENGK